MSYPESECYACGDPAEGHFGVRPVCRECYAELMGLEDAALLLRRQREAGERSRAGRRCGNWYHLDEDAGPGQHNAIRLMEG